VSLVASTSPSRGKSQRSLLVSVGTTFRTDNNVVSHSSHKEATIHRCSNHTWSSMRNYLEFPYLSGISTAGSKFVSIVC
jgi:hypothetical protein